ncbi:PulJ/GspJ family protein [Brevundimonas subvibrioides]|uniref:PulJ/GspJ family protein n=1 Tax=Brevundimonas subvibrioides TaxID=74313 RepID=UPI0032D5852A
MRPLPGRHRHRVFSRPSSWGVLRRSSPLSTKRARSRQGFTLVEVLIAMALFALIGIAGFTLLDGVLRTQGATETRLSRLAEIQRAMLVISTDLDQVANSLGGSGAALSLQKTDLSGGVVNVQYDLTGDRLTRTLSGASGSRTQILLEDVASVRWTFHRRRGDWLDTWPQPATAPPAPVAPPGPTTPPSTVSQGITAIGLDIVMAGLDGRPGATLRRVVSVPLMEDAASAPTVPAQP